MKSAILVIFVFLYLTVPSLARQKCNCISSDSYLSRYCFEYCEEEARSSSINDVVLPRRIPKSYSPDTVNHSDKDADATCSKCQRHGNLVPTYVLVLIGIIMFLLAAIAITFGVMLYRTKPRQYQIFNSPPVTTPENTLNANPIRRYVTQSSQDMTLLNINTNQEDWKNDAPPRTEEPARNSDSSLPMPNQTNKPIKIYKSVRKPVEHHVILKEQMKKICEDALAKSQNSGLTASLKDLNKLLNDEEAEKRKKKPEDNNIAREKSASFPQLDIYDEAPRNVPVIDFDDDEDIPLYDNLPAGNGVVNVKRDSTKNVLMPPPLESEIEPSYINARTIFP